MPITEILFKDRGQLRQRPYRVANHLCAAGCTQTQTKAYSGHWHGIPNEPDVDTGYVEADVNAFVLDRLGQLFGCRGAVKKAAHDLQ